MALSDNPLKIVLLKANHLPEFLEGTYGEVRVWGWDFMAQAKQEAEALYKKYKDEPHPVLGLNPCVVVVAKHMQGVEVGTYFLRNSQVVFQCGGI